MPTSVNDTGGVTYPACALLDRVEDAEARRLLDLLDRHYLAVWEVVQSGELRVSTSHLCEGNINLYSID